MSGCTPEPPPARPDAGAADGGLAFLPGAHTDFVFTIELARPDGGSTAIFESPRGREADAGAAPATAASLPLLSAEAVLPDGSAQPLARDGVTTVLPSARFRVEVSARLADARLSLLDAQDAMVAADGTTEATATTRFALTPAAPLRPGSSYTLRLDGTEGRLVRAEDGRSFEPVSLAVRASGEPAAPSRKAKRPRRR
jgi:hypothetical protein